MTRPITFLQAQRFDELICEYRESILDLAISANNVLPNSIGKAFSSGELAPIRAAMADSARKFAAIETFLVSTSQV